jgi:hypothetical protein
MAHAKSAGQDYIPVHIFPVRFNVPRSVGYLENLTKDDPSLKQFAGQMEDAFNYFEKFKQLPVIMIDEKGNYIVEGAALAIPEKKPVVVAPVVAPKPVKKEPVQHVTRIISGLTESVHEWPQFPGGGDAFMDYLKQTGHDMVKFLPKGTTKAYVQVEFIIDTDGTPVNFNVLKGMSDPDFNDELISRMEKMPKWKPAILQEKVVAKKMVQTVVIEP